LLKTSIAEKFNIRIHFSGKIVIRLEHFFNFMDGMQHGGMVFASERHPDLCQGITG